MKKSSFLKSSLIKERSFYNLYWLESVVDTPDFTVLQLTCYRCERKTRLVSAIEYCLTKLEGSKQPVYEVYLKGTANITLLSNDRLPGRHWGMRYTL